MDMRQVQTQVIDRVILDRSQEITAHRTALERAAVMSDDWFRLYGQKLNYHEMIAQHAESVGAEIAVAEYFGIRGFMPSINTFKSEADVDLPNEARVEVKHTKYANGHLILQESQRSRPNDVCILVFGRSPVYQLLGWMPAHMAMMPRYRHSQQANYWVNHRDLFEMRYLRKSNYGDTPL
jgi:hypothetical protein